jgi:flavin reductase (DIM6/NTAB) family NADH-FMN oxidoreductase RutF
MTVVAAVDAFRKAPPSGPAIAEADSASFRAAMRQLVSGVCLITQSAGGAPSGMTATAVASLSLDPPTLIVSVNRAASAYAGRARGVAFGVSVLGADHREFAERFAGRTGEEGAERFREGRWLIAPNGAPLLWDALAAFACEVEDIVERHTHAIVIGRVRRATAASGGGALVYWRGGYEQLGWSDDELARATGLSPQKARRAERQTGD